MARAAQPLKPRRWCRCACTLSALLAQTTCGSGGGGTGGIANSGSVSGTVSGQPFGAVASAYWVATQSGGPLSTLVFLSSAPLRCEDISAAQWDKTIGNRSLLEFGIGLAAVRRYAIGTDASANYLPNSSSAFNPSADSGTVTISAVKSAEDMMASFELKFGNDTLTGAFDATYCATAVEP